MHGGVDAARRENVLAVVRAHQVGDTLRVRDERHGVVRIAIERQRVQAYLVDSDVGHVTLVVYWVGGREYDDPGQHKTPPCSESSSV